MSERCPIARRERVAGSATSGGDASERAACAGPALRMVDELPVGAEVAISAQAAVWKQAAAVARWRGDLPGGGYANEPHDSRPS